MDTAENPPTPLSETLSWEDSVQRPPRNEPRPSAVEQIKPLRGPKLKAHLLKLNDIDPYAPPEPPRYIFPFIRPSDMAVVVAPAGEGKSTLIGEIAMAHSGLAGHSGECLGGAWKVNKDFCLGRKTLILDADQDPADWSDILSLTAKTRKLPSAEAEYVIRNYIKHLRCEDVDFGANAEQAIADLVYTCQHYGVGLLFIDPLHKVFGVDDVADLGWVFSRLGRLRDCLRQAGVTSIIMAHPAHSGSHSGDRYYSPAGSSGQLGIFDSRFGLKKLKRKSKLFVYKNRGIRWIEAGSHVELPHTSKGVGFGKAVGTDAWPHHMPQEPLDPKMLSILQACPPEAEFDLSYLFDKDQTEERGLKKPFRKATVHEAFRYVLFPRELVSSPRGKGTRGDPVIWMLTDKGRIACERG